MAEKMTVIDSSSVRWQDTDIVERLRYPLVEIVDGHIRLAEWQVHKDMREAADMIVSMRKLLRQRANDR